MLKQPELKNSKKKGQLNWKMGMEITKQNKTLLEVVRRLANK